MFIFKVPGECVFAEKEEIVHGFKIQKTLTRKEHPIYVFEHLKTGAKAVVEKTNNVSKHFSIGFKTPTENNKGINHIIEHCILDGYKECPVDNLFFELQKKSYCSELNGLTFPDYTCYPVTSVDECELNSIAQMYVNSIFNPKFLDDEGVFRREGIRFETNKDNTALTANGTVFNEMLSQSDDRKEVLKILYPDTQNQFVSGGYPVDMLDVKYEEICDTYRKYYHPSNCLIMLSGNVDYENVFEWLDRDYLSNFDKKDMSGIVNYKDVDYSSIKKFSVVNKFNQNKNKPLYVASFYYPVKNSFAKEKKKWKNLIALIGDTESRPYNFIKSRGYSDVKMSLHVGKYNNYVSIDFSSYSENLMDQSFLSKTFSEFLSTISFTPQYLSLINSSYKFQRKLDRDTSMYELSFPDKLFMESFIRYNDPCSELYMDIEDDKFVDTSLFSVDDTEMNNFVSQNFYNTEPVIIVYNPVNDTNLSIKSRVNKKIKALGTASVVSTNNLETQNSTNDSSNRDRVRTLEKRIRNFSEITIPTISQEIEEFSLNKRRCYIAQIDVKETVAIEFFFDISHLNGKNELIYFNFFRDMMLFHGRKSASGKKFSELISDKAILTTSLSMRDESGESFDGALIRFNIITTQDNLDEVMRLFNEWIYDVDFDDPKAIIDYIDTYVKKIESMGIYSVEVNRFIDSQRSLSDAYISQVNTREFLGFLGQIKCNINKKGTLTSLVKNMQQIKNKIINKDTFVSVGIICSEGNKLKLKQYAANFVTKLPQSLKFGCGTNLNRGKQKQKNLLIVAEDSIVRTIGLSGKQHNIGLEVLCKILNSEYLLPNIRQRGGAYFSDIVVYPQSVLMMTNADPNVEETLKLMKKIPEKIKSLEISQSDVNFACKAVAMKKFCINDKLSVAINQIDSYVNGSEDYCSKYNRQIDEIKNIKADDLKVYYNIFNEADENVYAISLRRKL